MILKIRHGSNGYIYIDNIYRLESEITKQALIKGTPDSDNAIWVYAGGNQTRNECIHLTIQHYMYEHDERTVKITNYIIEEGYILNDDGKTIEILKTE
jgi:hypothetical protein